MQSASYLPVIAIANQNMPRRNRANKISIIRHVQIVGASLTVAPQTGQSIFLSGSGISIGAPHFGHFLTSRND